MFQLNRLKLKSHTFNIFRFIFLSLIIIWITKDIFQKQFLKNEIKEKGVYSFAKVYDFRANQSYQRYYYFYYFNGKKYSNNELIDYFDGYDCVNRFYVVKFLADQPEKSILYLQTEITDTTEILKKGFRPINKEIK